MSNNNSTNGFLLVILLVLLGILVYNVKHKKSVPVPIVSTTEMLSNAETNGIQYSPTMASIRRDLRRLQDDGTLLLSIKPGKLINPILGQTSISIDSDGKIEASIVMDIEDAVTAGDMGEPLIGHEFKHVWDALFLYDKTNPYSSVVKFVETANKQKNDNVLYHSREVESSAIGIEDVIRKELIRSGNPSFSKLPASRQEADTKYAERAKFNTSLK